MNAVGLGGHAAVLRAMGRDVGRLWWLGLLVVGAPALALFSPRAGAVAAAFCVTSAIVLFFTWGAAVTALLAQNDPLSARLVPGQLRRLRETTVGTFLFLATACGALLGAFFGYTQVFIMIVAVLMLGIAFCLRWPLLWGLWGAPWLLVPFQAKPPIQATVEALVVWHDHQPFTQAAVIMGTCCAGLWPLFLAGGERHDRSWRRTLRVNAPMSTQGAVRPARPNGLLDALQRISQWAEPLWREHLIRTARPTPASVVARAELAALRSQHWSVTASITPLIFGAVVVGELAVMARWPDQASQVLHSALPGVSIGLMMTMMAPHFALAKTLHQTRREQVLLALLPGMPRGEAMNRMLAKRLMWHHVATWSAGVAMIVLVATLAPDVDLWQAQPLLGLDVAAAVLPAGLLAWPDWSRQPQPSGARTTLLTLILLTGMALCAAARSHWAFSPWWLVLGSAALTCAAGAWRWRGLRRMAPFWPVGRHAGD